MKISAIDGTAFQAKIKISSANIDKIVNSDKAKLVTGGAGIAAGTSSFLLGMDSWNCGVDSNVAERIYESALNGNGTLDPQNYNVAFANTISYALANSMPTGLLSTTLGLNEILEVKEKNKKIPD